MTKIAAVTQTRELSTEDLRASALQSGTAVVQETTKLLQSLEGADPRTLERVATLLKAGLAGVRGEISSPDAEESRDVMLWRADFITKYSIKVLGKGQVSFMLPSGTSRIDFLNEAQAIVRELYDKNAVGSATLRMWNRDSAFTAKVTENLGRAIDGNVDSSDFRTRAGQEAMGWNNVDLCDLAVAHVAYSIASLGRNDLFDENVVRARDGALHCYDTGLGVYEIKDLGSGAAVRASAALSFQN